MRSALFPVEVLVVVALHLSDGVNAGVEGAFYRAQLVDDAFGASDEFVFLLGVEL